MKVYVLTSGRWESEVDGVFATAEAAKASHCPAWMGSDGEWTETKYGWDYEAEQSYRWASVREYDVEESSPDPLTT